MRLFTLDRVKGIGRDAERGWPGYLFGGYLRTSTLVLVVAFLGLWWVYDTNERAVQSRQTPIHAPSPEVVPPGFVPDPNYTWVPRTRVQEPTPIPTPTTTTTPPTTTTTPPPFPQFVLPPPFGPGTSTPAPAPPAPGPVPPPFPPIVLPPPFGPPPSPPPGS